MAILDIFSKRQKRMRGEVPDVYSYDRMPQPLRVQIVHIVADIIKKSVRWGVNPAIIDALNDGVDALCREYGIFRLPAEYTGKPNKIDDLLNFIIQEQDVERVLDAVEHSFNCMNREMESSVYGHFYGVVPKARKFTGAPVVTGAGPVVTGAGSAVVPKARKFLSETLPSAVEELNERFAEHAVGYRYSDGKIIRIDSGFIHAEIVKPALQVLGEKMYAGAQEEFLNAHDHYRHDRPKEAINECLKALESVMKSICKKRGWRCGNKDGASRLIGICFDRGLVPEFWRSHFTALRSTLESGVPAARNKVGAHGQGAAPTSVPRHIAAYVLHMTAAAIVFLAEAEASGAGR